MHQLAWLLLIAMLKIRCTRVHYGKMRHIQSAQNTKIIPLQKQVIVPLLKIHPLLLTSSSPPQHAAHLDLASSGNFYAALMRLSLLKSRRVMSPCSVKKAEREQ